MCGIIATLSTSALTMAEEKTFKSMLQMDVLRGKHSTGLIAVDSRNEVDSYKSVMLPTDFLDHYYVSGLLRSAKGLVGHNRHATQGSVNTVNAHPFTHGDITMVHNGTITNKYQLTEGNSFGTDSEAICYNLAQCATTKDIINLIESLSGAYALVWWDDSDKSWNFCRNDERPLHWMVEGKTVYLSSERGILFAALDRAGMTLTSHVNPNPPDISKIKMLPVGQLVKLREEGGKFAVSKEAFTPKQPAVVNNLHYGSSRGYSNNTNNFSHANSAGNSRSNVLTYNNPKADAHITDLKRKLNVLPGSWLKGFVSECRPTKTATGQVTRMDLVVVTNDGFEAMVYQGPTDIGVGDEIEVKVTGLWMNLHGNDKVSSNYDLRVTCGGWKIPPVLDVDSKKEKDLPSSHVRVVCEACEQTKPKDQVHSLADGTHICHYCYNKDYELRDYCATAGIIQ